MKMCMGGEMQQQLSMVSHKTMQLEIRDNLTSNYPIK
jgi:hypothetical protein